jgi:hypothetical protein
VCSLSWREPTSAQRPLVATINLSGPFEVLSRPLTLPPKEAPARAAGAEPPGPIGWWRCEETIATAANAAVNKLTIPVGWSCAPAVSGKAFEFDGTKSWVECADSSDLCFRGGISVSGWFKVRAFDRPAQTLLAKGNSWRLQRRGESGVIEFALSGPATTGTYRKRLPTVATKKNVADGQWHHVAACYNGKRLALYLDGEEQDAVTASGLLALNNVPVTLGDNGASRGRLFSGWMNDVRLYDRGLSADEIKLLVEKQR